MDGYQLCIMRYVILPSNCAPVSCYTERVL